MFTLRCTRQLLARAKAPREPDVLPATTRLGDWSAKLVNVGGRPFVVAVAERTFLTVVVAAAPFATLLSRFRTAVGDLLLGVGVGEVDVTRELQEMEEAAFGTTNSRQVTGVMVDLAKAMPRYLEREGSLSSVSLILSDTPCGPLYKSSVFPNKATVELFGGHPVRRRHLALVH